MYNIANVNVVYKHCKDVQCNGSGDIYFTLSRADISVNVQYCSANLQCMQLGVKGRVKPSWSGGPIASSFSVHIGFVPGDVFGVSVLLSWMSFNLSPHVYLYTPLSCAPERTSTALLSHTFLLGSVVQPSVTLAVNYQCVASFVRHFHNLYIHV